MIGPGRVTALTSALLLLACGRTQPPPEAASSKTPFEALSGAPDPAAWIGSDPDLAVQAGARDLIMLAVEAGAPGDRIGGMISIPDHECALFMARASASVEDVDLFAYAADGTVLGADEAPDQKASVLVCPPHPARAYVVARVAAGHGLVAVGAQLVDVEIAERVGAAVGARGRPNETAGALSSWPGLLDKVADHRRAVGGSWRDVRRVALPVDPRTPTRISAMIEANRCVDLLVLPSDEVSNVDVSAVDAGGRILGRAAARGRDRAIVVCSASRAPMTLEVRPHAGRGLVAVVVSESIEGSEKNIDAPRITFDATPTGTLAESRRKNAERLERAGYGPAKDVGEAEARVGRRSSMSFELARGCARLDVLAAKPLRGLEAWLWSDDGRLLAKDRGTAQATLFSCGKQRSVRLDVEALNGFGRFGVELRAEQKAPAELVDHPLAASRLLARMADRGVIRSSAHVGAPTPLDLESTRLRTLDLIVPMERCIDVTVALGSGATGAEIRVLDRASGEEIAFHRGTHSTSARVCALKTARTLNARAELRVAAGRTRALVATRMLSPKR